MSVNQHKRALTWAKDILEFKLSGDFEPVRIMPWSSVYRINTQDGLIFLKIVTLPFDVEVNLLPYLSEQFPKTIPRVIASNAELCCILMQDSGKPLRPVMQKKYQLDLAIEAIETYVEIQQHLSRQTETLLKLGVPDWRLNTLPKHFLSLLHKEDFLKNDGLSSSDLIKLKSMYDDIKIRCERLSEYAIPETLEHGDMQDNNILINTSKKLIIHDWGDAVITHPFFSLCHFFHSAMKQHHIQQEITAIEQAYCDTWSRYDTKEHIQNILSWVNQLSDIKFALSFSRIAECPGMHDLREYKGTITHALKGFLNQMYHE